MADNLITEEKQNQQHTQTPIDTKSNSEANGLNENHSLRPLMGKYKDDPTWDEFMENIREYRREVNEKWNKNKKVLSASLEAICL
jgi:hypothetical protein